jgi:hypothetical protein
VGAARLQCHPKDSPSAGGSASAGIGTTVDRRPEVRGIGRDYVHVAVDDPFTTSADEMRHSQNATGLASSSPAARSTGRSSTVTYQKDCCGGRSSARQRTDVGQHLHGGVDRELLSIEKIRQENFDLETFAPGAAGASREAPAGSPRRLGLGS